MKIFSIPVCFWIFLIFLMPACGSTTVEQEPVSVLDVEMSEFKFIPSSMVVFAKEEITLNLSNKGGVPHDFNILKKGAVAKTPFDRESQANDILFAFTLGPEETGKFKFSLPESGEYQIVCEIQGHMESGMVATLTGK